MSELKKKINELKNKPVSDRDAFEEEASEGFEYFSEQWEYIEKLKQEKDKAFHKNLRKSKRPGLILKISSLAAAAMLILGLSFFFIHYFRNSVHQPALAMEKVSQVLPEPTSKKNASTPVESGAEKNTPPPPPPPVPAQSSHKPETPSKEKQSKKTYHPSADESKDDIIQNKVSPDTKSLSKAYEEPSENKQEISQPTASEKGVKDNMTPEKESVPRSASGETYKKQTSEKSRSSDIESRPYPGAVAPSQSASSPKINVLSGDTQLIYSGEELIQSLRKFMQEKELHEIRTEFSIATSSVTILSLYYSPSNIKKEEMEKTLKSYLHNHLRKTKNSGKIQLNIRQ